MEKVNKDSIVFPSCVLNETHHVIDSGGNLGKNEFGFRFRVRTLLRESDEELTPRGVLHDQV